MRAQEGNGGLLLSKEEKPYDDVQGDEMLSSFSLSRMSLGLGSKLNMLGGRPPPILIEATKQGPRLRWLAV